MFALLMFSSGVCKFSVLSLFVDIFASFLAFSASATFPLLLPAVLILQLAQLSRGDALCLTHSLQKHQHSLLISRKLNRNT